MTNDFHAFLLDLLYHINQIAAEGLSKKVIILRQENTDGLEERKSLIAEQISSRLRVGEIEHHLSSNRAIRLRDLHENELLKIEIEHLRSTAREESSSNIAAQKNILEKILLMENANSEISNFKYTVASQVDEIISLSKEIIVVREKNKCLLEHVRKIESVLTVCAEQNNILKRDVAKMQSMLNRAPRVSRLEAAAIRRSETLPKILSKEVKEVSVGATGEGGRGGRRSDRDGDGDREHDQTFALRNSSTSFSPSLSQELSRTTPSSSSSSSLSFSHSHSHPNSHSASSYYRPSYSESVSLPCSPHSHTSPSASASFSSSFRSEVVGWSTSAYENRLRGNDHSYSVMNNISETNRNDTKNKNNDDNGRKSCTDIDDADLEKEEDRNRERDKEGEKRNETLPSRKKKDIEGSSTTEERGSVLGRAGRSVRTLCDPTRRSLFIGAGLGLRKEKNSVM